MYCFFFLHLGCKFKCHLDFKKVDFEILVLLSFFEENYSILKKLLNKLLYGFSYMYNKLLYGFSYMYNFFL